MTSMTVLNRWYLSCQNHVAPDHQFVELFYIEPSAPCAASSIKGSYFTIQSLGNGQILLQFIDGAANPFVAMSFPSYRLQCQDANGNWNTFGTPFEPIPTGDGYFVLYAPGPKRYVTISPNPDPGLVGCYRLLGGTSDLGMAARLTATGINHNSIFDFLQVGKNATGLSFAGVDLTNRNLSGDYNLSLCDFREVKSLSGCVLDGTHLQKATFAGLHLGGLQISGADCTGADFTGCDFTSFEPGTPPPTLTGADLTRAVIPSGNSWSGAQMAGALLPGANLTGCDLSGPGTDLSGADFVGIPAVPFTPVFNPPGGIGSYNQASAPDQVILASPADEVIAYDYNGTGDLDHLLCYRPGTGLISILAKEPGQPPGAMAFNSVFDSASGIGGWDLVGAMDRIIAYDYNGTGHLDHLVCYRPGTGAIGIIQKNSDGTFGHVYFQGDPGDGIGGWDLRDAADRIIAYDYNSTGHLDHLVCYRPGTGAIGIIQKNSDGTFGHVYFQGDPGDGGFGGGIGGWDLRDAADRIIAYDYNSTGHLDHLVCYRPGTGAIGIIQKNSDGTFGHVYFQGDPGDGGFGGGIGGWDLRDAADRIIAYDYNSTGHADHLVCYRPGTGMVSIIEETPQTPGTASFGKVFDSTGGIGGYNLASPADQIIAYDYEGAGKPEHLICYRPGGLTICILEETVTVPPTLTRCNLSGANLSGIDLRGFDLTTTKLAGANLSHVQFPEAILSGVDLSGATLVGTNFTGLDLTATRFSSPLNQSSDPDNPTIFANCTLPYTVIGLDWSFLDLTATTITGLPTDLTGLVATGMRRPGVDFDSFILDGANFSSATLDNAHFFGAKLRPLAEGTKVTFAGARLTGAHFTRAVLDQVRFPAALGGVSLNQAADFSFAFISNCDFTGSNLYGVSFANATLLGGNVLAGATSLQQASFVNAYLPNADFTGANLQGAKFDGAFMVECVLTSADLTPTEKGAIAASLTSACLQAAALKGTKLDGADLTNAAITNMSGQINQQYYDENGNLTPMFAMRFGRVFPAPSSFSDNTTCPNGYTYGTDINNGKTMEQMMTAANPPTQWKPVGAPGEWRRS